MEKKPLGYTEGQEIEHSSKDHKDLWYPAKILAILHGQTHHENKKLLIQYQSLKNHTTGHFLSSYVDLVDIRPKPPSKPFDLFHLNQIVDAFVCNGWMKGKIIKIGGNLRCKVHFFNFEEEKILEFGVNDLRVHQDWRDGRWVVPQNQVWVDGNWVRFQDEGSNVKACKESDLRSLVNTSGTSCATGVVTPQTQSVVMYDMFEDEEAPSVSRYMGGVMSNQSSLEKVSASNAVISGMEIEKESDSVRSVEVSQPCKEGREGEFTEVPVRSKECNVGGTSSNNKMASENIVAEYSEDIGFPMPPVQQMKELAFSSGTNLLAQNEASFRSPISTSRDSLMIDMATQQTPSAVMCDIFKEDLSDSRNTGGVMNKPSTLENVSALNAVISGQEIKKESDSISSVEVSQACKKGREGQLKEVHVRSKECNVGCTSSNNKMATEKIVAEYSEGIGFAIPPVHCQKERDIQHARQIKELAFDTGTNLLTQNEASFPSPMSTSSNAFMISMATQQTPSKFMDYLGKDVLSMSRSTDGGTTEQSTSIEKIPPDALLPSQENLEPSHPASSTEISSPCNKERKGVEIDIPAHTEETSIIKNCRSSPLTDDNGIESEDRSVKTPFCNECASENTDVEYFGVVRLPTPRELALPTEQMNEPFIGTVTNLKARDESDFRSPDCTTGTSRVTGMATPQTPSMVEEALSVSRNTGGVMNNQSTLEKVSASNAVISGQEIMKESDSVSTVEVSQPCKKGTEGKSTEVSMRSKECNVGRISSNNEMAKRYIVAEYSDGIGFPMTAVQCQKELDVLPTQQIKDLAFSTGTKLLAQNEASFRSPISTSRDALMIDMAATPETPSAFMCDMFEEDLSVSRNNGAVMNKQSTLEKVSGQKIMNEFNSISNVEVSQPCKKGREGQSTEVPMRLRKCNSGGTSRMNKMESEKIVAEYSEGVGFPTLPVLCQKELDVLPTQQIKDLAFSNGINLLAQNEASFQSPISTSRDALMIDIATPQTPSVVMYDMFEEALSVSRNTGGVMNNQSALEKVSAPNAVISGQEIMKESDSVSSAEVTQPCKKGREGESTEVSMRSKECNVGGTRSNTKMASENIVTKYSEDIGFAMPPVKRRKMLDVLPTQQIKDLAFSTGTDPLAQNEASFRSPISSTRNVLIIDMATPETPSAVVDNLGKDVLSISRSTGGGANEQSTPIEKISPNLLCSPENLEPSDPISLTEVSSLCKKKRKEVETDPPVHTKEISIIQSLPTTDDKGSESEDRSVRTSFYNESASEDIDAEYFEVIGLPVPHKQMKESLIGTTIPQLGVKGGSSETKSGTEQSSGSSRSARNQMTTAKNQFTKTVDTEEALSTKNPSHLFTKTSPLWAVVEANEIFRFQQQTPHFRPLEKVYEECREGLALGNMCNFMSLWEGARNANLNDPRIKFENKIQALPYLEELGFNVEPIRSCLKESLKLKDRHDELNENITTLKRESLKSQLDVLLEKKKIINAERQRLEEIKKSRHGLDDDFVKAAAAPLVAI